MTDNEVRLKGIHKAFNGVAANRGIDIALRRGEVHAVLGENGAGKTTLMNILSGLYHPDAGEIVVWGETVRFRSPGDALQRGIGMVHQHFELVDVFTVTENILLGHPSAPFHLRRREAARRVAVLARKHGLEVPLDAYVWQLAVGQRQKVEILKLLYRGAELLLLDEPTAVLTPSEAEDLYRALSALAHAGKAVVFITHKLNEVMAVADRITILRGGERVATVEKDRTTIVELGEMMIGTTLVEPHEHRNAPGDEAVLRVCGLVADSARGATTLNGVNLSVRSGEILGVVGVAGNGQPELAEVIAGLRRPRAGTVLVAGSDLTGAGPLEMMRAGVRFVPEDRLGVGLAPSMSVLDNVILRDYRDPVFGRGAWINRAAARDRTAEVVGRFDVRTAGYDAPVRNLSGGNQQKLLLGRELFGQPRVLVVAQPTRGLDVGAANAVHERLIDLRNTGTAMLLISEDLDEAFRLADRIAVMYAGEIVDIRPAAGADRGAIGAMMGGGLDERVES